jgi:beta-lactam-binding protein with PASTA domain
MRLNPHDVIDGRYRLVERIGSGGMADVWRANDTDLGRDVAIKVLHENFSRDKEFVERFRREASSAAGLQHPNVVAVYDRGSYEDTYYIAMELVEGSSLRDLINRGLESGEAVEVTRQVLAAAGFAHSKGIVHRDLKPMNVLIDREGRIRVTDFGIARAGNSEITQTGSVMGTAQYLSPEQAQGMEVTEATDIYSIGVMLFEMLTGRVPFDGENAVAIAMKQVTQTPQTPSQINPTISPALDAVVLKSLAKDPAARYASAAEMTAALDAAELDPARSPGHTERYEALLAEQELPPPDNRRRNGTIAAIVLLLIVGAIIAYFLTRPNQVVVPDVIGDSAAEATLELQDAGLEADQDPVQNSAPPDTVIETDPRAKEKVDEGSTVTITVSLGPGTVNIPRVAGLTVAAAKKKLKDAGFESEVHEQPSDAVDAGKVISTDPGQGFPTKPGETVTLNVSTGVRTKAVPSVVGMDRSRAQNELEDAGFVVNEEPVDSDEPEDQVLTQDPAGNSTAKVGSTVRIEYSSGVGTISLDDFVGQKLTYAQRQLEKAGLKVTIIQQDVTDSAQDGIVQNQAPGPNTKLSPGDHVTLTVGKFTETEPPPPDDGTTTVPTTSTTP